MRRPELRAPDGVGAPGQGGSDAYGLWSDLAVTGLEDRGAATRSQTRSGAIVFGADTQATQRLLVGAAVTSSLTFIRDDADGDDRREADVGLLPYVAYQIDDRFSLQGAAGGSMAFADLENDGAAAETQAFRYFVSAEAGFFESWGDYSLYAGVSGIWGQGFQQGYTDAAGLRTPPIRSRLGSVAITAQPGVLFELGSDAFIEPYAVATYSYDVAQSKVAGAANDPDAIDAGVGANLFFGPFSGVLEITRMFGREDVGATTGRVTIRGDF